MHWLSLTGATSESVQSKNGKIFEYALCNINYYDYYKKKILTIDTERRKLLNSFLMHRSDNMDL